jgi:succinoglycan biosynthesis protein ExoM
MVEVSVCIPTRARPADLERLLTSLTEQCDSPVFEVIVVDNDPAETARPVARRFAACLSPVYAVEAAVGVSSARNRCVALSRAPLLAFIDDDEIADPLWLAELYAKMADPGVAAAVGIRRFIFSADVAMHRRACAVFHVAEFADGQDLAWWQALIGNSCLRRSALPDGERSFDTALNLTGGEDSHFFARMIARGHRVVGASRALTHEFRSAERTTLGDIFRRAIRSGGTGFEIDWLGRPLWRRATFAAEAGLRCLANIVLAGCRFWDRQYSFARLVIAAGWAGRALGLVGFRMREFARQADEAPGASDTLRQ